MLRRSLVVVLAATLGACATAGGKSKVDLAAARKAVEAAREAGAPERAPESFARAQAHLSQAEKLAEENTCQATALAQVAVAEAQCAADLAHLNDPQTQRAALAASPEVEKLTTRLRRAEEEQRRLEDRVTVLQRDLDITETEVIRTKSRLKGTETKAEASSAIAEARILMRRLADEKGRGASLVRCQELLARAEDLLKQENFGAAAFFALKAQDTAIKAQDATAATPTAPATEPERPAPKKRYVVTASVANIRKGPGTSEAVVAKAPKGASLDASLVHGDWLRVTFGGTTGWVHRSLVD